MLIKILFVTLALLAGCFIQRNSALNADEYIAYIEELSRNETFIEEYAKWSLELFSQPDYVYGGKRKFPCPEAKHTQVPTSVHTLRPSDIKCVGAMGDSLTAALGAHAITPIGLLFESRGVSWSVGGDHTYTKTLSFPNTIREYNPSLEGFSTKVSLMFLNGQNATNNGLNVAKSGDRSNHIPYQARLLLQRMQNEKLCDWNNDWKVVTLFIGGNDLCSFCEDANDTKHTPEQYLSNVRDALDTLYNAPLPRTLVNLVPIFDVSQVEDLNSGGFVCRLLHKRTCPCAAFPTPEQRQILNQYIPQYQAALEQLAASDRYDGREDFTVVLQPFFKNTRLPRKSNNKLDFSYFAPDCFHFSGKGHGQTALSLWNNMLEPVGAKQTAWHMGEELRCPSDAFPYIFTKNNSAAAVAEFQRVTPASKDDVTSTIDTTQSLDSTTRHHKHHKSDKFWSKYNMVTAVAIIFVFLMLLIVVVSRRQQIRSAVHGAGRRHFGGFNNAQYSDEPDDVEIWNRATGKSAYTSKDQLTKTHGARINFDS